MVRADKRASIAARGLTDRGPAMPTDVMHGVEHALMISGDNDGVFTNLEQLVIPFIGDFTRVQGVDPTFKNQMFEFPVMH
jgi:hypothetical protein